MRMSASSAVVVSTAALLGVGPDAFARPAAPENAKPVSTCYCSLSEGETQNCEYNTNNARWVSYKDWRRHVEIIGFDGTTTVNQSFKPTIWNVTEDDDVYLRVRIPHPLRYALLLKVAQEDSPDRPLLNFTGSGAPGLGSLIGLSQDAEGKSQAGADAAKKEAEATRLDIGLKALERSGQTQLEMLRRLEAEATALEAEAKRLERIQAILETTTRVCAENRARLLAAVATGNANSGGMAIQGIAAALWPQKDPLSAQLAEADSLATDLADPPRTQLKTQIAEIRKVLRQLEEGVAAASGAAEEGDMCLYLGRFAGGKTIRVSASVVERPGLSPLAADPGQGLRSAVEKAVAELGDALKDPSGKEAPQKDAPESGGGEKTEVKVDPLTYSFEVMKPIHISTSFGFPVSWLVEKEYTLVEAPDTAPPAAGSPGAQPQPMVKLVPQNDEHRVLPTFFVSLNIPPQYPSSTADPDPNEGKMRNFLRRHGAALSIGFPLADIGENYMFGLGLYAYPGVQLIGGVHLGRVTRLQQGFEENQPFAKPTGNFQVADATYQPFRAGAYFGLSVDSTAISKILGAGK